MKRALRILLLLGALAGLFGQQAAYALGPSIVEPLLAQSSSMATQDDLAMMDCAEMMAQPVGKTSNQDHPCKGLTLACIAQMGCTVPVLLVAAPMVASIAPMPLVAFEPTILRPLSGRSLAPEPEPPTY